MCEPRAMTLPLIDGHSTNDAIAWRGGARISAREFLSAAHSLAERLPERRFVFNLSHDRYHFLLGFAAALWRGQISLLPPSRVEKALARIGQSHFPAYCLSDGPCSSVGLEVIEVRHEPRSQVETVPCIAADTQALVAFTSGSTGTPMPHVKTFGSLVQIARATARRIDFARGHSIAGTIPAQHMYGIETTIMLPMQSGGSLAASHPLTPADIAATLEPLPAPRWLATTPLHLRACVAEKARLPEIRGVICATMPLSQDLCRAAEDLTASTIHEIYGCTEAGTVGLRRPRSTNKFAVCGEAKLVQNAEDTWIAAAHLAQPVKLPDRITLLDEREFILHGRNTDMVKIGGKRASLGALTSELVAIAGVRDGVFYFPDQGTRLMAFAVAPGMSEQKVMAALRERIDPAFLPRPLVLLDSLPRNPTGKLPREHLAALARAAQS
jgi:acyl-coenzyme A synthetase/AMP-(fatty) acid ligase